jgi:hypothetical protein
LGDKGVECLTRRPLLSLRSLSLPQNSINSLDSLPKAHWQNIANLTLLVLSSLNLIQALTTSKLFLLAYGY